MTDRKYTLNAAKAYVAQYDSYKAQLARVQRGDTHEESWEERIAARRWRFDPLRSLEVWPESHWLGFALRQPDVLQSYTTCSCM